MWPACGSEKGAASCPTRGSLEAAVFWSWNNYLETRAAYAGQQVLRINMDETPVCPFQGGGPGNILLERSTGDHTRPNRMQVPKGLCRTYLTYLAFVCNDAELQPFLPQIIIGNQAVFKARDMERLQSHAPPQHLFSQGEESLDQSGDHAGGDRTSGGYCATPPATCVCHLVF